jgi:lysophospholipase L1-like esterase
MSIVHTVSRRGILENTLLLGGLGGIASMGLPAMSLAADRPAAPAQDFAGLNRYRQANASLGEPAPGENRVVFMGDSITDAWPHAVPEFFSGRLHIGRGIGGQTTQQMLIRFRPDVIQLKPKVVVILAGTNDLAGNTGPATPEEIQGNLMSMAELARVYNIRVVLASIPPAIDFPWRAEHPNPAQRILSMNAWIKDYAARNGFVYLDYHSALTDDRHGLKKEYATDAVHPNRAGYLVMGPLAEKAIAEALQAK